MRDIWKLCLVLSLMLLAATGQETDPDDAALGEEGHDPEDEDADPEPPEGHEDPEGEEYEPDESTEDENREPERLTPEQLTALHAKMDVDGDRKLSSAEVLSFAIKAQHSLALNHSVLTLPEVDTNKDGKASLEEWLFYIVNDDTEKDMPSDWATETRELEKQKFKIADKDGNGFLDKEELRDVLFPETHKDVLELVSAANIKAKDQDGDGHLSHKEMWDIPDDEDQEEGQEDFAEELKRDFAGLDTDKNGKLSRDELKAWESGQYHFNLAVQKLFALADQDKNQFITLEELKAAQMSLDNEEIASHFNEWAEHFEL